MSWRLSAGMAVLVTAIVVLQVVRERAAPLPGGEDAILYVRSPEAMKRLALSYDALLADIYWIRAIQHFGDTRRATTGTKSYPLLYPLLDLTTSLDPLFDTAYSFGAIFLAEPPPEGPGRIDQAIRLLEKGIAAQPEDWRLVQALGFVHYWWARDYQTAAKWFERSASLPGGPNWMKSMAAVTLEHGGDRNASRQMWMSLAREDPTQWMRREAERRLRQLDALDQMDELRAVLARFEARAGRPAATWRDVVAVGLLRGVPLDPMGQAYLLNQGTVALEPKSRLLPLPNPGTLK